MDEITSIFDYLLLVCLIGTYLTILTTILISIYNIVFNRNKYRHLIFIQLMNLIFFVIVNFALLVILQYVYHGISINNILQLIIDFSNVTIELNVSYDIQLTIFFIIINWDAIIFVFTMIGLCSVYIKRSIYNRRSHPELELSLSEAYEKFGFLIVCHNSSDRIENTIKAIQLKCPNQMNQLNYNIFISDNGSTLEEQEKTKNICYQQRCIYLCLKKGSKTLSQFATANYIKLYYTDIKYIVCLDDDIILPETWDFIHMNRHFVEDSNVIAVALPLIASNRRNYLTECQNLEYLMAGCNKIVQSALGTCLFGSGGFTVYLLDYFIEIVTHHTTTFRGEDLQLGLISHSIYGIKCNTLTPDAKLKYLNPKIACCSKIFVGTDVPIHLYHIYGACKCGEPSFYHQRAKVWEVTRHRFVGKFIRTILAKSSFSFSNFIIKCYVLYEIILVINDWVVLFYLLIIVSFFNGGLLVVRTFFLTLFWNIPFMVLFNYLYLKQFKIPIFIILSYNFYYRMFYNWIIKISAIYYNILKYWPKYTEPDKISVQYSTNAQLRDELYHYWKLDMQMLIPIITDENSLNLNFDLNINSVDTNWDQTSTPNDRRSRTVVLNNNLNLNQQELIYRYLDSININRTRFSPFTQSQSDTQTNSQTNSDTFDQINQINSTIIDMIDNVSF